MVSWPSFLVWSQSGYIGSFTSRFLICFLHTLSLVIVTCFYHIIVASFFVCPFFIVVAGPSIEVMLFSSRVLSLCLLQVLQ